MRSLGYGLTDEKGSYLPDHYRADEYSRDGGWLRIAVDAKPAVLVLLSTSVEHHWIMSPAGGRLLAARERFLSRRVGARFGGYASAQLERQATPAAVPERETERVQEPPPDRTDFSNRFEKEQLRWQHCMDWRNDRNQVRSDLGERFGYDTKHGMRLVRLQRIRRQPGGSRLWRALAVTGLLLGAAASGCSDGSDPPSNGGTMTVVPESSSGEPEWIVDWLDQLRSDAADRTPERIVRYDEADATYYFALYGCCDQYSDLFDADGFLLGHPDGGFTGKGDGSTSFDPVTQGVTIWPEN